MNINNSSPVLQNNEGETVTLIALPVQLIQQAAQNNPLFAEQNLFLKILPDGTLVIDANQIPYGKDTSLIINSENNDASDKVEDNNCLVVVEKTTSEPPTNVTLKTNSCTKYDNKNKQKIRYIHCRNTQDANIRRPGRPRKPKNFEKTGPFKCKYCEREFDKWILYRRHEKTHNNEKKYKCSSCTASYSILSNFILHVATHNTSDPTCPECGKKFQRVASLKAHLAYHEKEETFYCQECDINFNNDIELGIHLKDHGKEKKSNANSLQCRYCEYKFVLQSDYKKHMSEHNKMRSILNISSRKKNRKSITVDRRHHCMICNKPFQKASQVERHMRVHSGEKPFVCSICDRGFSQKGSLQIHMTKHNGVKPYKCGLCPAKFSQKGNLRAHILKTHSVPRPGENIYACSECSCVFKKLGTLNGHMTRNHPETKGEDIKAMISQLVALQNNLSVDKDILQQAILRSELTTDVQMGEKANDIPNPVNTYVTLANLGSDGNVRRYVIKQRKVGDVRWHLCTFCPKEFRKPSDLVRHLRVHTREKPFKCKLCFRSFAVKSTLTTHIKTHAGVKDYKCKICAKNFMTVSSLNLHLRTHCIQKSYTCGVCNKCFKSPSLLKRHSSLHLVQSDQDKSDKNEIIMQEPLLITSRGLQTVDVPLKKRPLVEAGSLTRPYTCIVCNAGFRKLSHLKQHRVMHTGERPFQCPLCQKNFTSSGILKTHILTHNGTKPHKCDICDKQFTTSGSLRRHRESHNSNRPVLCPYCLKNFRTLDTCRKHMKLHKAELSLQLQAEKQNQPEETSDVNAQSKTNEIPYTPDLTDALTDETFVMTDIIKPVNGSNYRKLTSVIDPASSSQLIPQEVHIDETGTVVLPTVSNQENITQANIHEIEDTLNSQMLNIIGSENYVDTSEYINKVPENISTTDELVNTLVGNSNEQKMIDESQMLYQNVFVNMPISNQLTTYDNTGIDNFILSQLKFQNDSLFLTDLNSVNLSETNSVLLPYQISNQNETQQASMIMMPSELEQSLQNDDVNTIPNKLIDTNLHMKSTSDNGFIHSAENVQNANIMLPSEPVQTADTFLNSEDSIIHEDIQDVTIVTASEIENNVLVDDCEVIHTQTTNNESINDDVNIQCSLCKNEFKSKTLFSAHHCLNIVDINDINMQNKSLEKFTNTESLVMSAISCMPDNNSKQNEFTNGQENQPDETQELKQDQKKNNL